jgi:hypothetical protein
MQQLVLQKCIATMRRLYTSANQKTGLRDGGTVFSEVSATRSFAKEEAS